MMIKAQRAFLVLLVLILPTGAISATEQDDQLIEAVQQQHVDDVKRLLEAGANVDAANRYGATALFFAVDKGNVELVDLLLAKGASVDIQDTFYNASPLGWASFKMRDSAKHRDVVLRLLAKAPADSGGVLSFAVERGDLELLRAAVATEKASGDELRSALDQAKSADKADLVAFLVDKVPATDDGPTTIALTAEQRQRYVGDFKNDQLGMTIKVFVEGDELKAQAEGQPALGLDATAADTFHAREAPIDLTFAGRGGLIESFLLAQGGQEFTFARVEVEKEAVVEKASLPPIPPAVRQEARPWPSFRGAGASGIGDGQGAVTTWNGADGTHVRWKTPIPGIALSSPIVWGDRVFLTTSVSEGTDRTFRTGLYGDVDSVEDESVHIWKVYALDLETGNIVWQREASRGVPQVKRHMKSSHANPTPVTDGKKVVAHLGSEGLYCYSVDGELLWKRPLGRLDSGWFFDSSYQWGFASSPILFEGKVIVQTDIHKGSFIAAFALETGEELWRTARNEIPTWGTPNVLPAAKPGGVDEVVTNGPTIRGYDAATGQELWTLSPNSEVTVGTPIIANGLAYVTGGYPPARPIYAIRPGARGDISLASDATSSENIAWSVQPGGTYIPTPIAYQGILYMLNNNGRLAAYDAATGELIYRERIGSGATSFSASPVAADGRLFLTTEEGDTHVIRAGRDFEHLATNELGEVVMTTPALSDGLLVLRGIDHVYGLGEPAKENPEVASPATRETELP